MTDNVTQVLAKIVTELTSLKPDERIRVIRAALVLLGEDGSSSAGEGVGRDNIEGHGTTQFPPRARMWMQQSSLSVDQLEQVFHFEEGAVQIIASDIPGSSNRERVRNAYLLTGIAQLLVTGETRFDDRSGRELCEASGFYDPTNHAKFFKSGNELTGSREKGWVLTSPGLKAAAKVIAEISARG